MLDGQRCVSINHSKIANAGRICDLGNADVINITDSNGFSIGENNRYVREPFIVENVGSPFRIRKDIGISSLTLSWRTYHYQVDLPDILILDG